MNQPQRIRITSDCDTGLKKIIQEMADKKNWPFSYMSYVLLQQAVKEKNRKKKPATEESHT
jgi:hypothetical protein